MDDFDSNLSVESHAEQRAVDGLLRAALRGDAGSDASLERALARVRGTEAPRAGRPAGRWSFRAAAAAVLLIGLGVVWVASNPVGPMKIVSGSAHADGNRLVTREGEKAAVELADRSLVRVAENTELVVRPKPEGLQVEMPQGQAVFEVTKKAPGKSFEVATAHGQIVVHGTKFTATVDQGALVVRVEEGCVEVRNAFGSARLYPGEHAVLTQDRAPDKKERLYLEPIKVEVPPVASDPSVKIDYDIVYVRARRAGDEVHKRFYTDFSQPVTMEPGADLMLLHPDGTEELLAEGGGGSITDPVVSFDGQWVYFSRLYNLQKRNQWSPPAEGADLFKLHLKSRKLVRLTNQVFAPNTGAGNWASDYRNASRKENDKNWIPYGVFNMGPCPLPGGKLAYTSNREGFRPSKGYPAVALQLFVMDDRDESVAADDPAPSNLHKIGHFNIAGALHPVVLSDGRIMFSTLESQGVRSEISWGIWTIHPDGTNWGPLVSAFDPGGAANGFHFQTQLSDGSVIVEEYYNQNNSGFGAYIQIPAALPEGAAGFGPAFMNDPRNGPWRFGRFDNGKGKWYRMPFMPTNSISFTPFSLNQEGEADPSIIGDKKSPRVGKFTHPSGAPDNHLLTVYSPGPVNHQYKYLPQLDGGLYLVKGGKPVQQPADMLLIKNDPNYNEGWPRAVVPYERVYGMKEPRTIRPLANDGTLSPRLPEGTPFGLVGSSSLYKRESYPNGVVPEGQVTATYAGGKDPWRGLDAFTSHGNGMPMNWHNQGGDAGLYSNDEIHALRVLVMEPTSDLREGPRNGRRFTNHASERLRIIGEIPVRKFDGDRQPVDPDQNPDTSFLARIPADTAFTFQTIDRHGLVLNMSQTWHQVRPGEIRTDCGGCHAHSQKPTRFEDTAAAKPGYEVWDLLRGTPLVTSKAKDESGRKWDATGETGLRTVKGAVSVEYRRDIQPILKKSCVACHTKGSDKPAGNLVLDADDELVAVENHGKLPGTYVRLALDERARFGVKPVGYDSWGYPNASRYVRKLQARRSLLTWKVFGRRLDGFSNDDHPSETEPGSGVLALQGRPVDLAKFRSKWDLDYRGEAMPPADAVAGTYVRPDGRTVKVEPLTDEDRRTIARWIDLGCPIDLDYDPKNPEARGAGWMCDDNRPVLTLTRPAAGPNPPLSRIRLGMHDYGSGLDPASFKVTADVAIDGAAPGTNLAPKFAEVAQGVWELKLSTAIDALPSGRLVVEVKDRQGNTSRIERLFSVRP
jgi:hypothetical protein